LPYFLPIVDGTEPSKICVTSSSATTRGITFSPVVVAGDAICPFENFRLTGAWPAAD